MRLVPDDLDEITTVVEYGIMVKASGEVAAGFIDESAVREIAKGARTWSSSPVRSP
jgi:hypothetical protein